jgi:hypothetical protein
MAEGHDGGKSHSPDGIQKTKKGKGWNMIYTSKACSPYPMIYFLELSNTS